MKKELSSFLNKTDQKNDLCLEISDFVCSTTYEDLPPNVVQKAKNAFLDTIGVTIGALAEDGRHPVLSYTKAFSNHEKGEAVVFGQGYRTSPALAALANGTLAHLLDFDDSHNPMGGHPSAPLVSATLAVGDQVRATGKEIILAFALGFEVETKLSRVVNPLHYARGWHPTSILSTFGAAAATARLLGLNKQETATALATAASLCSGIKGNFGTLTKPLHVGMSAQSGIQAAYLASFGHTANTSIFETKMGFLDLFCSENSDDWKLETVYGKLGFPWELSDPGVTVKPYPCCGSTHSTIDAHLTLRQKNNINPRDIVTIRNAIHERRIPHTNRPTLEKGLEGKFSNQFVTALSWLKGYVSIDHFTDEVLNDPEVQDLMRKVELCADPDISKSSSSETHAFVEVVMKNRKRYSHRVSNRKGSPDNPMTDEELDIKFRSCTERVQDPEWIESILHLIRDMEQIKDVRSLTSHLCQLPAKTAIY